MSHAIRIVGPRELDDAKASGVQVVSTVSRASTDWQRELSPFHLGPCKLYGGHTALCMENGWQFAKLFRSLADANGQPTPAYWAWAKDGWSKPAIRYPMGKGAKPLHLLWDGEQLDYVTARHRVYWRLYRDAVRETAGFRKLRQLHLAGPLALFDFDGFDHEAMGMTLADALVATHRPMGHAFVLKSMLLFGADVEAADVLRLSPHSAPAAAMQADLF